MVASFHTISRPTPLRDVVARYIRETYPDEHHDDVQRAVECAVKEIDAGGDLASAMCKADRELHRNPRQIYKNQIARAAELCLYAEIIIRDRMHSCGPLDIAAAINTAKRIIDGGGSLHVAFNHAFKHSPHDYTPIFLRRQAD